MNRNLYLVVLGLVAPAACLSLPVEAAPAACDAPSSNTLDQINEDPGHFAASLAAKGVKVNGIEDFGGCLRVYTTDANGQPIMAYYDPNTLQQINVGGTGSPIIRRGLPPAASAIGVSPVQVTPKGASSSGGRAGSQGGGY
jgi:hypothetical protein